MSAPQKSGTPKTLLGTIPSEKRSFPTRKHRVARLFLFTLCCILLPSCNLLKASNNWLVPYELEWTRSSRHAGESMPCGGGDIGLNVWVENGDILIYMAKSDAIDEAGLQPKLGRLRIQLSPNPFSEHTEFSQILNLREGCVEIMGENYGLRSKVIIWVDAKRPVIDVDIASNQKIDASVSYENWHQDDVTFVANKTGILFYHQNRNSETCFDDLVRQQGLTHVMGQMNDPLKYRIYGGLLRGTNMTSDSVVSGLYAGTDYMGLRLKSIKPATRHKLEVVLHTQKAELLDEWDAGLAAAIKEASENARTARKETKEWWEQYWDRSYIRIADDDEKKSHPWSIGRDYQLYRYLMASNAQGSFPMNARGGLFSFDPSAPDSLHPVTPDYRSKDEKGFTAQRQLLTYWPLLKSGDFDLMKPQMDFYLKNQENATIRTNAYWNHSGSCFPEQMELFGLPTATAYGTKRPLYFDPGVEYNKQYEYHWDNVLGICLLMLDIQQYTRSDSTNYLPFIESTLRFFDEHYQYLSERRTTDRLDADGHLVLYPGSSGDTYKMATNATSTISGLTTVLNRLSALDSAHINPESRRYAEELLTRIPPLSFTQTDTSTFIAPARSYERINGSGQPQLTPVFPFGQIGIGKPDLQPAVNTWKKSSENRTYGNPNGMDMDRIFCARLGLTQEADSLMFGKTVVDTLADTAVDAVVDSTNHFPLFSSREQDGTPDLEQAGATAVALQEMLLQTDGPRILLFPAWPKDKDVSFKLHAPFGTTVEATLKNGKLEELTVTPESRNKDVVNLLERHE